MNPNIIMNLYIYIALFNVFHQIFLSKIYIINHFLFYYSYFAELLQTNFLYFLSIWRFKIMFCCSIDLKTPAFIMAGS